MRADLRASLTSGWAVPSRRARMEKPRLCQSTMRREPRTRTTSWTSASVGIEGGFCLAHSRHPPSISPSPPLPQEVRTTDLDEDVLGRVDDVEQEDLEDGRDLEEDFDGREEEEERARGGGEERGRGRDVAGVEVGEREERRQEG